MRFTRTRVIIGTICALSLFAGLKVFASTPAGQVVFGPGSPVILTGATVAAPGATAGGGVIVDTVSTLTNGLLLDVRNNGTSKASIDFSGKLSVTGIASTGALVSPVAVKTSGSPYTVAAADTYVAITTGSSAAYTVNLPACVAGNVGETHTFKKVDTGTKAIIIAPSGTDTIDSTNASAQFGGDTSSTSNETHGQFSFVTLICRAAGAWDVTASQITVGASLTSGTPSTWTVTVPTGSKCVCSDATTAELIKCAVASTTLTATGPNTVTSVVNASCQF